MFSITSSLRLSGTRFGRLLSMPRFDGLANGYPVLLGLQRDLLSIMQPHKGIFTHSNCFTSSVHGVLHYNIPVSCCITKVIVRRLCLKAAKQIGYVFLASADRSL